MLHFKTTDGDPIGINPDHVVTTEPWGVATKLTLTNGKMYWVKGNYKTVNNTLRYYHLNTEETHRRHD